MPNQIDKLDEIFAEIVSDYNDFGYDLTTIAKAKTAILKHYISREEVLGKLPKKQMTSVGLVTDPHDLSKGPVGRIPVENGYNQALDDVHQALTTNEEE